jgi:hypothetical protein
MIEGGGGGLVLSCNGERYLSFLLSNIQYSANKEI